MLGGYLISNYHLNGERDRELFPLTLGNRSFTPLRAEFKVTREEEEGSLPFSGERYTFPLTFL